MTVKGHYCFAGRDNALLALYITTTNNTAVPFDPKEQMQISEGSGDFEPADAHLVPGLPHVSMYADGKPFASLYFGTEAEALEESKASWITYTPPDVTVQLEDAAVSAAQKWLASIDKGNYSERNYPLRISIDGLGIISDTFHAIRHFICR